MKGEKHVEKPNDNSHKAAIAAELKRGVASNSGRKTREVKCFKCHGYGHIAFQYPNKRVMIITDGEVNSEDEGEQQRENIFHIRCIVNDNLCNMIINGRSYNNVASKVLVDKLNLLTIKHLNPYTL